MEKIIVLTCLLILENITAFTSDNQNQAIAKCIQKTGVDESTVTRMGITLDIPDNSVVKKFLSCLNKKLGFQSDEGDMLFDNLRENLAGLSSEEVNSTVSTCKQVKGTNSVENSYLVTKCMFRKIKSIIKLKKRK
uniref:Odorant binding protein 35 n=1 Tax=Holotrichia parallela TaxID=93412 RepID=A0A2P1ERM3_HOLPA|nr:odorant binding protein 35 [Holotrichia parallela]